MEQPARVLTCYSHSILVIHDVFDFAKLFLPNKWKDFQGLYEHAQFSKSTCELIDPNRNPDCMFLFLQNPILRKLYTVSGIIDCLPCSIGYKQTAFGEPNILNGNIYNQDLTKDMVTLQFLLGSITSCHQASVRGCHQGEYEFSVVHRAPETISISNVL
jgi:hypothetical protein